MSGTSARMSFLLDPPADLHRTEFAAGLQQAVGPLRELAVGGVVRAGTRSPHDPLAEIAEQTTDHPFGVIEGAVELTFHGTTPAHLADRAGEVATVLDGLIDRDRSALTVGLTRQVLPATDGSIFLALAFARYPGTSVEAFRTWWLTQHAPLATRLLGPHLRAYDQVHVDRVASRAACHAAGIAYQPFDAYDNLAWSSVDDFLRSVSEPGGREEMYEDEEGHIDHSTYRGALMVAIS